MKFYKSTAGCGYQQSAYVTPIAKNKNDYFILTNKLSLEEFQFSSFCKDLEYEKENFPPKKETPSKESLKNSYVILTGFRKNNYNHKTGVHMRDTLKFSNGKTIVYGDIESVKEDMILGDEFCAVSDLNNEERANAIQSIIFHCFYETV